PPPPRRDDPSTLRPRTARGRRHRDAEVREVTLRSARVLLHALDRTGPPMLALSFLRWLRDQQPGIDVDVVTFRGGPMLGDFVELGPVAVLVDPSVEWDHDHPDPARVLTARRRAAGLGPVDVALAVSVAAAQVLPYLPQPLPALATWSVE